MSEYEKPHYMKHLEDAWDNLLAAIQEYPIKDNYIKIELLLEAALRINTSMRGIGRDE